MIEVRFSAATRADLHATMREYLGSSDVTVAVRQEPLTVPPAQLLAGRETTSQSAPSAPAESIPYATVADLIPKMVSKHGKPKVVALLDTFGVKNGKELKVEQYAEFVRKATAELPLA